MDNLIIYGTPESLDIICKEGLIKISGCSIIRNPKVFFHPLQKWIADYLENPPDKTIIHITIDYIDSASSKYLFSILKSFEESISLNTSFRVSWYYDPLDPEVYKLGQIFSDRIKIPFHFINHQNPIPANFSGKLLQETEL